jgi:hypothetical protein
VGGACIAGVLHGLPQAGALPSGWHPAEGIMLPGTQALLSRDGAGEGNPKLHWELQNSWYTHLVRVIQRERTKDPSPTPMSLYMVA